jgi:hypothetical protein
MNIIKRLKRAAWFTSPAVLCLFKKKGVEIPMPPIDRPYLGGSPGRLQSVDPSPPFPRSTQ